jgi:hypothetical protein
MFVGGKMLVTDVYTVPIWTSLLVVAVLLTGSILASLLRNPPEPPKPESSLVHRHRRGPVAEDPAQAKP